MPIEVVTPPPTVIGAQQPTSGPRNGSTGPAQPPAPSPQSNGRSQSVAPPPEPGEQDETEAPEKAAASKTPEPEELWEVNVNGKPRKLTKEQARAELSKRIAAEEMYREAAKLRKEAEEREKKPWHERIDGEDEDARNAKIEEYLWEKKYKAEAERQAKLSQYPEEARPLAEKLLAAEQRAAMLEAKQKADEEGKAKTQREQELAKHKAEALDYYGDIAVKALEAAGIPGQSTTAARLVPRLADRMLEAREMGAELSPELLAADVKRELTEEAALAYGSLEGAPLLEAMGDEWTLKVVRAYVARKKAAGQVAPAPQMQSNGRQRGPDGKFLPEEPKRLSMEEWRMSYTERKAKGLL